MLTGVILAGGQNRRMGGRHKALLPFHEERVIERQIQMMKCLCQDILIVTNVPERFEDIHEQEKHVHILTDEIVGYGPLSGMHAALRKAKNESCWVAACDMPFISSEAAKQMWLRKQDLRCDAVVPFLDGKLHPLHGIYDRSCEAVIETMLRFNLCKVMEFLQRIRCARVQEDFFESHQLNTRFVTNMNTPEQYEEALQSI